ncbi:MAG: hypothetical protein ACRDRP_25830, partial [Pseudonocardiaceae bacterium]
LDVSNRSVVSGTLTADGLTVAGSVFLADGSQFTDIRLHSADIGGQLDVSNRSVVSGTLTADGLTVAGSVFLADGSQFTDIRLHSGDIGGTLEVDGGSVVSGTLTADGLTVAGDVFLRGGSQFADIRLPGADIGGDLDVDGGSVVSGTLTADQTTVAGNVFLGDGSQFKDIRLPGAAIGGLIVLEGATWGSEGSIDLRQAHVGGILTDDRVDSWPATMYLGGFTFEQWVNPDPAELGSGWFTGVWLDRLDAFSPGPYNQLAAVLDAGGHPTIAADVRYSRSRAESLAVSWSRPDRWGRWLYWLVLGYGLRPWWALGWFFAVWLIGCLALRVRLQPAPAHTGKTLQVDKLAKRRPQGGMRRWRGRIAGVARLRPVKAGEWSAGQAALYSLDRLLPAVNLVDPDEFPAPTRAQGHWLTFQTLLGWLLTLFIVGWLGSLLAQT